MSNSTARKKRRREREMARIANETTRRLQQSMNSKGMVPKPASPPPAQAQQPGAVVRQASVSVEERYQGPLPHPETLRQFEQVLPGSAQSIINEFHAEAAHRRSIEKAESENMMTVYRRHQRQGILRSTYAFVISIAGVGAGWYEIHLGHPAAGATIITATVVSIVAIFVTGKRSKKEESSDELPAPEPGRELKKRGE